MIHVCSEKSLEAVKIHTSESNVHYSWHLAPCSVRVLNRCSKNQVVPVSFGHDFCCVSVLNDNVPCF